MIVWSDSCRRVVAVAKCAFANNHVCYFFVLCSAGKPAAAKLKSSLLEFSGFLSAPPGDGDKKADKMDVDGDEEKEEETEEEREARDEILMVRLHNLCLC